MAEGTIERIQIILQAMTSKFSQGLDSASSKLKTFGRGLQNFGGTMKMSVEDFRSIADINKQMGTNIGGLGQRFRMLTHGLRGFRMEMLGVMFFGMMLQRTFMGMLQPVMDAYGVFDLFRILLLTTFLPVMEMIFPVLMQIFDFFINLPEPVQKSIGVFVLLGAALGFLLSTFGSLALGLGSLIQAFPLLGSVIQGIGTLVAGITAPILAVIAIVVAVLIGMYLAWQENFMGMRDVVSNFINGVKTWFGGIINIVKGVFNIIKGILTGDFDTFINGIKQLFTGLWGWLKGGVQASFSFITGVIIGALKILENFVNLLLKVGTSIGNFISGKGFIAEGAPQLNIGGSKQGTASVNNQSSVNITNNYNGFTTEELKREVEVSNSSLVQELRRSI